MKRFLSFAAATLLIASAFPALAGDIHAGVRAGVNMANVSTDVPDADTSFRNGLALGGFVAIPMNEMITIQPEALFMMKGTKTSDADPEMTTKLNYIEIPVLAKVQFMQNASAHPLLFAGPSLGINTTATATDGTTDQDLKDNTSTVDFGLVFGGGVDVPIADGKQNVGVDVRYNLGLTNIDDSGTTDSTNGTLSIMGFWSFI